MCDEFRPVKTNGVRIKHCTDLVRFRYASFVFHMRVLQIERLSDIFLNSLQKNNWIN